MTGPALVCRALALALFAAAASACVRVNDTYGGTGTLLTNGAPSPGVASMTVRILDCSNGDGARDLVDLGTGCLIDGTWVEGTFVGRPGGTCVLTSEGGTPATIRTTDVIARLRSLGRGKIDPSVVDIRVGGDRTDTDGPPKHVLFTFTGTLSSSEDADARCSALGLYARGPSADAR